MADKIEQQLGFDASPAIEALKRLDAQLLQTNNSLKTFAQSAAGFNGNTFQRSAAQTISALNGIGAAGTRNATTIRGAFEQLISVNGRYSTSLGLLSRIAFTQAVVSGFREIRSAITDSVRAALNFEKQLAEIRSIDTGKVFDADLGKQLRQLSAEKNIPLPDIATGAYEALSAQVLKSAEDIRFLNAAADFAKGTLTSNAAAVKGLAGALNAYGQGTEHVDRLASQFNETIRLGTIRGEELANQFGTVATLGNQLGVTQAELLASIAALTNAGVPQAQAFTQLRGVMVGLVKPSEQLNKVFRENGIASAEQLIATQGLGGALKFLQSQTDGTTAGTAELFRNQRALLGVLSLGGQNAQTYANDLASLNGVMNSLNSDRAMQVMATDAEQLEKKWNQLKTSMIPIGSTFVTVANTGLDAASVLRDFAIAAGDTTGSLIRLNPTVREFGTAWQNLQALFGKDLTIGDSGGKILGEIDARKRLLDVIARQREDDQAAELAAAQRKEIELNKLRFTAIDNFRDRNRELLAEAQSSANAIINVEKAKVAELTQQINQAKQLLRESPTQIKNIEQRQDRREFDTRTSGLTDAQKSFALMARAAELASKASADLAAAGRNGNQALIQAARQQFELAQSTGEEAASLAQSTGERRNSSFAAQKLRDITSQQLAAERSLASITQSRLPTLEQQRAKQQQSLAIVQQATAILAKNSSIFDKQGDQLQPQQLEAQAKARAAALQTLLDQGISKDKVVDLQFRTDSAVQKLQNDLQSAMNQIDATAVPKAFGEARSYSIEIMTNSQIAGRALAEGAKAYAEASKASFMSAVAPKQFGGLMLASGGFARGKDTLPAMLSKGESVLTAKSSQKWFSQIMAMNAGLTPNFRQHGGTTVNNNSTVGDVAINLHGSQATPLQVAREIERLGRRGMV